MFIRFRYVLIHLPILRNIYLNGPNYKIPVLSLVLGFWSGKQVTVICSESSGQSSEFWNKNILECNALLESKIKGFIILIEMLLSIYLILQAFKLITKYLLYRYRLK